MWFTFSRCLVRAWKFCLVNFLNKGRLTTFLVFSRSEGSTRACELIAFVNGVAGGRLAALATREKMTKPF